MEPALNCTDLSQSRLETTLDREEALGVLQEVCRVSRPPDRTRISAAILGVSGSLLSCGLLLAVFFCIFTVRFRGNRIVKMSSPNLNLVILLGSALSYISAFLFLVQEPLISMETVIQVRISLLYVGITLVFGPLLGKSWRLHRVFSHRVPDKRVIIKDLTLLGLVALLLFADSLLLLVWVLSDPVSCVRMAAASIRAAGHRMLCAVSSTNFCASLYADLWIGLLGGFKGALLVYGSYLAGLTRNISSPPVNQSLVIMVGSALVILAAGAVILINRYFYSWPNLVYGITSGSILICSTTINCLVFIPQLLQWRQFEEEQSNSVVQMAKYFNSPSKSFRSMYSEEQIYQLLGENTSMRRLLTEKNAVIESLQEQVNSAKDKLVQLLKSEESFDATEGSEIIASSPSASADQHIEATSGEAAVKGPNPESTTCDPGSKACEAEDVQGAGQDPSPGHQSDVSPDHTDVQNELRCKDSDPSGGSGPANQLTSNSRNVSFTENIYAAQCRHPEVNGRSAYEDWEQLSRKVNYVSSDKLQEILKELSVETLPGSSRLSPRRQRRASHSVHREHAPLSTEGLHKVCLSLSPYLTRRRRGHAHNQRSLPTNTQGPSSVPPPACYIMRKGNWSRCNRGRVTRGERAAHPGESNTKGASDDFTRNHPLPAIETTDLGDPTGQEQNIKENGVPRLMTRTGCSAISVSITKCRQSGPEAHGMGIFGGPGSQTSCTETDSSSSDEAFCYCHRPYCELCFPKLYDSSDSCTSEADTADQLYGWSQQPVVNFKEDLKPTFV
ncbi:probable G-protein coupled receptor 156 [Spea bombifrons]|uniref:probable G-protein coupled receptor 156 n=1 Tax=Spea bombifrons TaxID=233779 RepID=UPI00234A63E5|nr:probable G-protein coupled receptor 156 [Spea bombifrons]